MSLKQFKRFLFGIAVASLAFQMHVDLNRSKNSIALIHFTTTAKMIISPNTQYLVEVQHVQINDDWKWMCKHTAKFSTTMLEKPRLGLPAGSARLHQTQCLRNHRPARMSRGVPHSSDGKKTPHAKHINLFPNSILFPYLQFYLFNT